MSDEIYAGGPVMIKIDGTKIRQIREQKGLTQLYVATAVEVTTDTVSRWENKRYPSIKKENGLKLAQALEVPLDEILDLAVEETVKPDNALQTEQKNGGDEEPVKPATFLLKARIPSFTTAVLLSLMFIPLLGVSVYFLFLQAGTALPQITVDRTVSANFIAGQPLPVFIQISSPEKQPVSFILRENLPPGTTVLSTYPQISEKHKKNNSIQWLGNISSSTLFIYTLSTDDNFTGTISFNGTLKISSSSNDEISVSGDHNSTSGLYHWADKDQNNRISDEEILTVYDLTNASQYSEIDMDLLEEIWLGDGYIWQPDKLQFSILE